MSLFQIIFYTTTFFSCLPSVTSQLGHNITANIDTLWIHFSNESFVHSDNSTAIPILYSFSTSRMGQFSCGFYCDGNCPSYVFAIILYTISSNPLQPKVVWSANRNNPVGTNATLQLTAGGGLVLRDADGTLAWSTDTAGRSVSVLSLEETGNLVLLDANSSVVWQSFDHPTDCLVPGQILVSGMNLTASVSSTNSTEGGLFSLSMTDEGLVASLQSEPPHVYWSRAIYKKITAASYAKFRDGSLDLYINEVEPLNPDISISIPDRSRSQKYIKLDTDGHLRVFSLQTSSESREEVAEIFNDTLGECDYPMVCGKYGICSTNGQCSCPNGASFRQISKWNPNQGCSEVIPITCNALENHSLLDLDQVTYFAFTTDIVGTDINSCKEACLRTCSCKAAIFRHGVNTSTGDCFLPSQIFSLKSNVGDRDDSSNVSVSIKIQIAPTVNPIPPKGHTSFLGPILGSILGVSCIIGIALFGYRRYRRQFEVEEDYLDQVPGMPSRFSFEELAAATEDFNKKLGEGGFGSVFEGSLNDGTRIAVKCLDGIGHIKKSFLAEVESIGSIHHNNLVRLIGFCAEKSNRLLVYEYMCNCSLDKWIYCRSREAQAVPLDWSQRRKIILDIAKGLAYLHEDCRQKIIHLDIKPQNILLGEHYNAKLGDFGLSKLIDRNQSNVITTMRGTPGYLAPEWLNAVITEKVDVYSFGIVVLEIVCGKKIFDQSKAEEERYLPTFFMKMSEEGRGLDLADKCCLDVESNVAEIEEMMQVAAWCLQRDHRRRPCMSMVIKFLEGAVDVQKDIGYSLLTPEVTSQDVTHLPPSVLSGPR